MKKIDLNAYYDTDLSRIYFDDFLTYYKYDRLDDRYYIFYENEDFKNKSYFKKSMLVKMTKKQLVDLSNELDYLPSPEDLNKKELIKELLEISNSDYYSIIFDNKDYHDLPCNYELIGYSQNDYLKIVLVGSNKFIDELNEDYLTNLFFDCPCTINIQISEILESEFLHKAVNEELLYLDLTEYLASNYQYDKSELLENFKNNYQGEFKEEILIYLQNNLSEILDYM